MPKVMTQRGSQDNVVTYTHFCDTHADMDEIEKKYVTLGSSCVVIKDEKNNNTLTFYLGTSEGTWERV